jgi:hypothetical protein
MHNSIQFKLIQSRTPNNKTCLYVNRPQFSIAPAAKFGIATRSIFGSAKGTWCVCVPREECVCGGGCYMVYRVL